MAKVMGGIVHRGDATAHFSSLASPTGKTRKNSDSGQRSPGASTMANPVKAANAVLRRGK